ncbi:MAG: hypothetical protein KAY37_15005 [Phycisphaerae bacterium]|nr:hypothetical protein [Phycisphaerae bacterium]
MRIVTQPVWLMLVGVLLAGAQAGLAQELFFVTGVVPPGAATLETAAGRQVELTMGRSVIPGTVRVAEGGQLMLFEESGVVAIVLGPATIAASQDELSSGIQLEPRDGKLMFVSSRAAEQGRPIMLLAELGEEPGTEVELSVEPGHTYLARTADLLTVAYVNEREGEEREGEEREGEAPAEPADETPASIAPRVNGRPVELSSNEMLTVDGTGAHRVEPLGDWPARQGFVRAWGRDLGVASARELRVDVETNLFNNIIAWDRYAGAAYVASRLREQRFDIEIRQTVQAVSTFNRPSQRGAAVETKPFDAANEVPLLSPASASVQNTRYVGQGVTAIELNSSAAAFLQATGSRGLGFRGLRQLAIPGVTSTGLRTIGPAGLGAQP